MVCVNKNATMDAVIADSEYFCVNILSSEQQQVSEVCATPELAEELRLHVRKRLAAHAYPREIEFVSDLPKTPSGKLQRFILRNQEIAKAQAALA